VETIHVKGEGGSVWEMDLPLRPDHQQRLDAGLLVRVNPDGTVYDGPVEPVAVVAEGEGGEDDLDEDQPPELAAFLDEPPPPAAAAPAKKAAPKKVTS
jgi:hypothetical protein